MRTITVFAAGLLIGLPSWGAGVITATASLAEVDTIVTTPVTQRVDTYSTELRARIGSGSYLYDQTFAVAFGATQVQTAITTAQGVLSGAGAVNFNGPTLGTNTQSLVSSNTVTVANGSPVLTQSIVNTKAFIGGPLTINTGNFGLCQSYTLDGTGYPLPTGCTPNATPTFPPYPGTFLYTPFTIVPGGTDYDTFSLQLVTINQTATTTNTFLTTQVYDIVGFPAGVTPTPITPTATPIPPSLLLTLVGLAGCGFYFGYQRRAKA